ncbi:restriction endonuclease subunit S [Clostridium sp. DFI.5.61]|uniref:restriction endonuclease subunit S n=1 Tax=Clostridium sp. DFI.5.61 TaxID=2965279 RepID=UPI002109F249|nr:restriction endonuclease subunit S [Clostridium sp. DFI.5.61]MCB5925873.1 restriction endonuclease subunit S [bacterium 210820-DFI.5.26]MCQ5157994.1 restriction endonuclease subunit S [Clostridium sp. DFI.5.61]
MTAQQLKNSILLMAVQGKLVPQDPNDEPASVLLERIHAEKERLIKEKKIKREKNPSVIFKGADNTTYEKIGDEVVPVDTPFDIPDSWEWVQFKDLVDYSMGKTPPRKETEYWSNGTLPWVSIADLVADGTVTATKECVNSFAAKNTFKGKISKAGTLLMSFKLTVGKVSILGIDAFHNEAIISIYPFVDPDKITTMFLFATLPLLSQSGDTKSAIKGNTLNSDSLDALLIPLPPIMEQKRIFDKLHELTTPLLDYGAAEQKVTELNVNFPEALKKSILQEAVQGKLVPQDPNDEPAEALLERIRAEKQRLVKEGKIKKDKHESVIFRRDNSHYEKLDGVERCIDDELPFEIPESWTWVRWGSIAESIQYGYNAPAKQEGRIRMVRISDIHENTVAWSSVPFCDIEDSDIPTYLLQPNDILFARTGGTVGKSFLVSEVPCKAIYAGYLIRTRYSSLLCPQYLKYFMESPLYWLQLKSGTTATAQPNCNGQTLAKILLPLPPANEQLRIVENLARTFAIIERM